jgi:ABC-2 type transport system permease protein
MTLRRATMLVARREFSERIRSRALQVSAAVTVLIVAGIALAAGLIGGDGRQEYKVGAHGSEAVQIADAARASAKALDIGIEVRRFASAAKARAAAAAGDVDAAIIDAAIVSKSAPPAELEQLLQVATRDLRAAAILRREGISETDARMALAPPPLAVHTLGASDDEARKGVAFVASLLLYMQLVIFGLAVASGVVEEKSSRVVEVLLASVPARALLAGKIIGIGLLALIQLMLTAVVGLAVASASGAITLASGDAAVLAVVLLWFLLGFLFYSSIYAIAGVIVSRQEDLQSSSTPVTMVLVAGYLVAFPALEDPSSPLAVIASLVPFTSPIVMPVRVAVGEAGALEIAASLGVLVLSIALLVPLGARIYERAVLRMGKPMKLREAWRVARAARYEAA